MGITLGEEIIDGELEEIGASLAWNLPSWKKSAQSRTFARWRPREVDNDGVWGARVLAYQWKSKNNVWLDAADTESEMVKFSDEAERLLTQAEWDLTDGHHAVNLAQAVFDWGKVSRQRGKTPDNVRRVLNAARGVIVSDLPVPWSSGWTKLAAVATYRADVTGESSMPHQVIWDSRVSVAVADLIDRLPKTSISDRLRSELRLVTGRGGTRNESDFRQNRLARGWKFTDGAWESRSKSFWHSQHLGSRVVATIRDALNSPKSIEPTMPDGRRWTSFGVSLALFIEGY